MSESVGPRVVRVRAAVGVGALVIAASVCPLLGCHALTAPATAGFWYEDVSFALPIDTTAGLGGPLTEREIASIKQISRIELERAFCWAQDYSHR